MDRYEQEVRSLKTNQNLEDCLEIGGNFDIDDKFDEYEKVKL